MYLYHIGANLNKQKQMNLFYASNWLKWDEKPEKYRSILFYYQDYWFRRGSKFAASDEAAIYSLYVSIFDLIIHLLLRQYQIIPKIVIFNILINDTFKKLFTATTVGIIYSAAHIGCDILYYQIMRINETRNELSTIRALCTPYSNNMIISFCNVCYTYFTYQHVTDRLKKTSKIKLFSNLIHNLRTCCSILNGVILNGFSLQRKYFSGILYCGCYFILVGKARYHRQKEISAFYHAIEFDDNVMRMPRDIIEAIYFACFKLNEKMPTSFVWCFIWCYFVWWFIWSD